MQEINKEEIRKLFEEQGYYISDYLLSKTCLGLYYMVKGESIGQEVFSICLDGPSGAGKTFFVDTYRKIASKILGCPVDFINFQLDGETGKSDLYEDIDVVASFENDTSKIRIPGKILEAFKAANEGHYVVLKMDEYDKAREVTDTFFNNCLQEGLINTVQHGDISIKKENRGKLQVFLCKNDVRAELSEPMMRRNRIARLDYMTPERLYQVLQTFVANNHCDTSLLNMVTLIYQTIYHNRDLYRKLPSCSECEQAIMDAHILLQFGDFTKHDIYQNIIEDLLKMSDDIKTFEDSIKKTKNADEKKLASLVSSMKETQVAEESVDLNTMIAEKLFSDESNKLKEKIQEMQNLIDEYKVKFNQMEDAKKKEFEQELQKITLNGGKLISTKEANVLRNFDDESLYIKRGYDIFSISDHDWTDIASISVENLSHYYFIEELAKHAHDTKVTIYENGILLVGDRTKLKIIAIRDLDENQKPRYRILSEYPVIPSDCFSVIPWFIWYLQSTYERQYKTKKQIANQGNNDSLGTYSVNCLVYDELNLSFDSVQEHVYHIQENRPIETYEELLDMSIELTCKDYDSAIQVSENIMAEKRKVLKYES